MKLSSYQLKLIAIVTMFIDHIAKTVLAQPVLLLIFPEQLRLTYWIYRVMTWIGRIAFLLFAFMIAEGCVKTRSMPKYILRLAVFAIVTQPIYHLLFSYNPFLSWESIRSALLSVLKPDNIFVILTLGALTIYAQQRIEASGRTRLRRLIIPVFIAACFLASFLRTGYDAWGVALIFGFYLAKTQRSKALWAFLWSLVFYGFYAVWNGNTFAWIPQAGIPADEQVMLVLSGLGQFVFASLSVPLILAYSGKRGRRAKWVFYIFYPAHQLILYTAAVILAKVT
ncbi:MAG: conjugal transfer protein TraX [Oscillospiraceae bacterium]|jgi:hypothetical protein|nr:conjugal transfer protein TraX [Oscillospiraceae bacterium]